MSFFLLQNSSILAILLGIAFLFIALNTQKTKLGFPFQIIKLSLLLVLALFIIILNSRIVWVSFILVFLIINKYPTRNFKEKRLLIWLTVVLVLVICLFYKYNSTLGRLTIYKVDLLIIKDFWLTGIYQPFNISFNHTQAAYFFNKGNPYTKEIFLASNGFFVFNEWLNIFIRFGIFGFVASLILSFFLIKVCFFQLKNLPHKKTIIAITIFLLIIAFVSYPFSVSMYSCIFMCCVLNILKDTKTFSFIFSKKYAILISYLIVISYISYKEYYLFAEGKKRNEINELFKIGYTNKALENARALNLNSSHDGYLLKLVSKMHLQKNNKDSAIYFIQKAHEYICTDDLHIYWGDCLTEVNRLNEANEHYTLAVNIVPHKFANRLSLLNNLLLLNELKKAKICAIEMIELPEKIPSAKAKKLKQEAKRILDSLNNIL